MLVYCFASFGYIILCLIPLLPPPQIYLVLSFFYHRPFFVCNHLITPFFLGPIYIPFLYFVIDG